MSWLQMVRKTREKCIELLWLEKSGKKLLIVLVNELEFGRKSTWMNSNFLESVSVTWKLVYDRKRIWVAVRIIFGY